MREEIIKTTIAETFRRFRLTINQSTLKELKSLVESKNPNDPQALAFIIARNKAVDIIRKGKAEDRRIKKAKEEAKKEGYNQAIFEFAKKEFEIAKKKVIKKVRSSTRDTIARNLSFLKMRIFEGKSINEIRNNFSRAYSVVVVKKGIQRARGQIKEYCSDHLWKLLTKGTHQGSGS